MHTFRVLGVMSQAMCGHIIDPLAFAVSAAMAGKKVLQLKSRLHLLKANNAPAYPSPVEETPMPPAKRRYSVLSKDERDSMSKYNKALQEAGDLNETQISIKLAVE